MFCIVLYLFIALGFFAIGLFTIFEEGNWKAALVCWGIVVLFAIFGINDLSRYFGDFGYIGAMERLEVGEEYMVLGQYSTPKGYVVLLQNSKRNAFGGVECARFVNIPRPLSVGAKTVTVLKRGSEKELVIIKSNAP